MTLGEHIQTLRKNAGLSQEELGEKLGVARQSVSKWESDATIPELDKLIAMSKLFGISVGGLLGMEESDGADRELTDRELAALEAIAQRLTPPQKDAAEERPRKKRRWPKAVAVLTVIVAGFTLMSRINNLENQINSLHYNISNIDNTVSRQIGSLTGQVKDILEAQNSVTAGKNYEVVDMDLLNHTVTFALTATPREYRAGMTAVFSATGPDFEPVEVAGVLGTGQAFAAELTCPLTDDITLWVGFTEGEAVTTQQLGQQRWLFSETQVDVYGNLSWSMTGQKEDRKVLSLVANAWQGDKAWYTTRNEGNKEITIVSGTLRLWKGEELIWSQAYEEWNRKGGEVKIPAGGDDGVVIPAEGLPLAPGQRLILSLLYTDSAGREQEVFLDGFYIDEEGDPEWIAPYTDEWVYPWDRS